MDRDLLEKNFKKANNQLFNIDCRRSKIKKEIYSLYSLYLKIIRSKLKSYLAEAIKVLSDLSSNGMCLKDKKNELFIKDDLKNLVNNILPFLTIEQLSIKKEYKIAKQIKNNVEFSSNYTLKEEVLPTNNFESNHEKNSINYCNFYYRNLINENNFKNINIENYILENKYFDNYQKDVSFRCNNPTILLKDFDEDRLSININQAKDSKYFIPIEFKDIILWIDTIESSLNLYLQELSIEINNELLKSNILKRFINNDLLLHVFENHLLFNNPSPFILSFDPSMNQYINLDEIYSEEQFSKISLININTAELEYININLSMLKNKLLEIKSNIHLLIKKENYWCKKLKLNSNTKFNINKI